MTSVPSRRRTQLARVEACAQIVLRVLEVSPPCGADDLVRLAVQVGMRRPAAEAGLDLLVAAGLSAQDAHGTVIAVPRNGTPR